MLYFFVILFFIILLLFIFINILAYISHDFELFFTQERIGKDEKPFLMYKYKTMRNIYDTNGNLLPDAQRTTWIGFFLRKTSIDEFPQIFNILKGDMNLVGPRPLPPQYLPYYSPEQRKRHKIKGGITGLAQVKGGNLLNWQQRFELDVWYVENRTFWLDVYIIWLTLGKFFLRNDANVEVEPFGGNESH
jgi:lipopolysaccharide/colanic/teichoic acid biosynthesis glycosyltransferase